MNKRLIFGFRAITSTFGMFVSQPGFNVDTCSADQMLFASDQWLYQPIQSGYTPVSYATTTSVPTIASIGARARLHVVLSGVLLDGSGNNITDGLNGDPNMKAIVTGGSIFFYADNNDGLWPTSSTLYIGWTIFRGLY